MWNKKVSHVKSSNKSLWNKFQVLKRRNGKFLFSTISVNSTKLIHVSTFKFLCTLCTFLWCPKILINALFPSSFIGKSNIYMTSNLILAEMLILQRNQLFLRKNLFFEEPQLQDTYSNKPYSLQMNNVWYIFNLIQDGLFCCCSRMGEGQKDLPPP